jgi:hypothetical protein
VTCGARRKLFVSADGVAACARKDSLHLFYIGAVAWLLALIFL